jgi:glutathione peroxidase
MNLKTIAMFAVASLALTACSNSVESTPKKTLLAVNETTTSEFHNFKVADLMGADFDFAALKGKRVLIVNTASKCGFTSQYKDLQELYTKYGGERFEIIGFPSNDFGQQEPGSSQEIAEFCTQNYGVSFPMMEKIAVKGDAIHPVYQWLTNKALNGVSDASVKWNFTKFLVDENGNWVATYGSMTSPTSKEIVKFASGL